MTEQRIIRPLDASIVVEGSTHIISVPVGVGQGIFISHHDLTDAAKTFTAVAATDICTLAAAAADKHPRTGLKGRLTTTGTLPAGLALATDYFCIETGTASQVKFASSLANARAGVAVNITDTGTGTHTFTPTTGGTRNFAISFSLDGVNYSNVIYLNGTTATTFAAVTLSATVATLQYDLSLFQNVSHIKFVTTLADGQARLSLSVSHAN